MSDEHDEATQEFRTTPRSRSAGWHAVRDSGIALVAGLVLLVVRPQVTVQWVHDAVQALAYGMFAFTAMDLGQYVHRLLSRRDISADR